MPGFALFNPDVYAFNPHAIATLVTTVTGTIIAIVTLIRERGSRMTLPFALVSFCLLTWMFGATMMYLSSTPEVAEFWARFGQLTIAFIPACAVFFTVRVVHRYEQFHYPVYAITAISFMFFLLVLVSDLHTSGIHRHWWGYYPSYGPAGLIFVGFIGLSLSFCLHLLWQALRSAEKDGLAYRRIRLMLIGILVASLSAADVLATFAIPVYPVGFMMLFAFFCIMAVIAWNYHFIEITPAAAGRKIIETMSDALLVLDENARICLVNPAASGLLGLQESELVGTLADERLSSMQITQILAELDSGTSIRDREVPYREASGAQRTLSLSASRMHDRRANSLATILVMCDVTHRKMAEERINFLAFNDDLTRLPNRLSFYERFEQEIELARKTNRKLTILYVDLDRFKRINDTLGHIAGDDLLCIVVERLNRNLTDPRDPDAFAGVSPRGFAARVGADEFALALLGVVDLNQVRSYAGKLLEVISEPVRLGDHEVTISASIGIAQYPQHGTDTQTLLKNADTAMYHAKDMGRNAYRLYEIDMNAETVDRLALENDLRRALERGQLELHYQPQIEHRSGAIVGCEALLRWHHPERGMVSPAEFIPLAEEAGLINKIGAWTLNAACRQAQAWHTKGYKDLKVAVNLSGRQFRQANLVLQVAQAMLKSGVDARLLELELTEGTVMRNAEETMRTLHELKSMGVGISVDDFGTGYSSLSYLKRLPLDVIKIDRSFVNDITTDPDDRAIVEAIIGIAHSLKKSVIAEGVETEEQADFLSRRDCHIMQGYLFSPPVSADEFGDLLRAHARRAPGAKVVEIKKK